MSKIKSEPVHLVLRISKAVFRTLSLQQPLTLKMNKYLATVREMIPEIKLSLITGLFMKVLYYKYYIT